MLYRRAQRRGAPADARGDRRAARREGRRDVRPGHLNASGLSFERDERDELVLEGLAIMYRLADQFEPHRPGYNQPGRFSGYAAMFLPRRLTDAWHRLHPEHCYSTDGDGRRKWVALERALSLDGLRSEAEERGDSVETRIVTRDQWTQPRVAA